MSGGRVLRWGVLHSFVQYVEDFGGAISVREPAIREPDGRFVFPEVDAEAGRIDFAGQVRFTAHGGLLDVAVSRPRLRDAEEAPGYRILSVERQTSRAAQSAEWIDVAKVSDAGAATLMLPGIGLFDGRYAPGHELADVQLSS